MTDEKRQQIFNKAMEAWSALYVNENQEWTNASVFFTTEQIKDMISGIIEFSEDDIAEWLMDHGYEIGMNGGNLEEEVRWLVYYEAEE